jgi:flagellar basal body L-ring protein FlgH
MENELFKLSDRLVELRGERDDHEAMLSEIKSEIEQAEYRLAQAMTESETPNFTHGGSQFVLTTKTRASSVAGEKEGLFAALRANGHGDIITENVNANTLSSTVKGLIEENGDELPEWLTGLVNVFEKTGVTIKKARR